MVGKVINIEAELHQVGHHTFFNKAQVGGVGRPT